MQSSRSMAPPTRSTSNRIRQLLWALREQVGLDGNEIRLRHRAQCGACTVLIDGEAVRSCGVQVFRRIGRQEDHHDRGGSAGDVLHKVQKAWITEHDVPQCGYCQSGMILSVVAL